MQRSTITPRQCKKARSLLKWNIYDVASRSKVQPKRIESFERAIIRLTNPENTELSKVFKKQGILFTDDLDAVLTKDAAEPSGAANQSLNTEIVSEDEAIALQASQPNESAERKEREKHKVSSAQPPQKKAE